MKLVLVAFLAVTVSATFSCDTTAVVSCTTDKATCTTAAAGDAAKECVCQNKFVTCAKYGAGCDDVSMKLYSAGCKMAGCTEAQCNSVSRSTPALAGLVVLALSAFFY